MDTEKLDRLRRRYKERCRRNKRKDRKPRCEVVMCGSKGPHQCHEVACCFLQDGHRVCHHHFAEQHHVAVFTEAEALERYRARHRDDRLWLTEGATQ